jgi:hemerythrin-like metal-binding protein/PAS domain S-box-containing protein
MKRIDIFPWDENFTTGVDVVDEQHRKLVDIINDLATQFSFKPDDIDIKTIFDELIDYTHYHFETEEQLWEQHFGLDESVVKHKESHVDFIDTIKVIIAKQEGNSVEHIAENILNFLVQWLVAHILESDRYMAYVVKALQSGKTLNKAQEFAADQMSGHTRQMINIVMRLYDTLSHNTLRLMRELDQQHKTEKKLQSNEALLRTVIDEIPDVLLLKDHEGRFLLGNRVVADFYGTTPEAMIGKRDIDFGVPKEIADAMYHNVLSIMERGETEVVYEKSRNNTTGEIRHFKSVKKPFKDDHGNNQILVIAHDMTDEIRVKDQLRKSEESFRSLFDSIDEAVYVQDATGTFLAVNNGAARMYNRPEEWFVGKTPADVSAPGLNDHPFEHIF